MTTFSYTTGNPANLTGGASASMNDIQGPLTDLRTFLNGLNLDFTNLAAVVQSDYNTLLFGGSQLVGLGAGAVNLLGTTANPSAVGATGTWTHVYGQQLDPADFALTGRTAKYRLRVRLACNTTTPGGNFTVAVNQVSGTAAGAAGQPEYITALAAAAGSVTFNAPLASSASAQASADFAAPAAALYTISVTNSAAMAANSCVSMIWMLQRRTV